MKLNLIDSDKYFCEITTKLDVLTNIRYYKNRYHYILNNKWCKNNNLLAIRVSGGTVGTIYYNTNFEITKIMIDTNYIIKTYPEDINDIMQKYIGVKIEF